MKTKKLISHFLVLPVLITSCIFSSCKQELPHTVIGIYNTTHYTILIGSGYTLVGYNEPVFVKDIDSGNISVEVANLKYNLTNSGAGSNHFSCDTCVGFKALTYFPEDDSIEFHDIYIDFGDSWQGKKIQ